VGQFEKEGSTWDYQPCRIETKESFDLFIALQKQ
jgi:hypothetical protein